MNIVGYLTNTREGLRGDPGLAYNYILAGNGLWVEAPSPLLVARVCVAEAQVRGLQPLEPELYLPQGKVPRRLYELAVSAVMADPWHERYLAITWASEYRIHFPPQDGTGGRVTYERLSNTLLDIHSHGQMGAFFSGTDDQDEQGLGLYMVVGKLLDPVREEALRVGVYGYFAPVNFEEVFG